MEHKIEITNKIANALSKEMTEHYGYETKVWWRHHFFQRDGARPSCKFVATVHQDFVIFPNDDMAVMFLLKYAS